MHMGAKPEEVQTVTKMVRDGRVTVPLAIREALGIKTGDKILLTISKIEE
jgi:AbrB family looped-hinge helix DNA binding protein